MESDKKLVVVVDHGGRQFIGKLVSEGPEVVELEGHLKYIEQAIQVQGGPPQVQMQFSPPSHIFIVDKLRVKWLSLEEVTDERMISAYEQFSTQIRAARAGIQVAGTMPQGRPNGGLRIQPR